MSTPQSGFSVWRACLLLAIATLGAFLLSIFHPMRDAVGEGIVSTVTLAQAQVLHPIWIDGRTVADFTQGHIPGAILVDQQDWDSGFTRLSAVIRPNSILVVYCSSLGCHSSHETAIRLRRELGLNSVSVYVLEGGFEAWQTAQKRS